MISDVTSTQSQPITASLRRGIEGPYKMVGGGRDEKKKGMRQKTNKTFFLLSDNMDLMYGHMDKNDNGFERHKCQF
jgi:hypothetical protein